MLGYIFAVRCKGRQRSVSILPRSAPGCSQSFLRQPAAGKCVGFSFVIIRPGMSPFETAICRNGAGDPLERPEGGWAAGACGAHGQEGHQCCRHIRGHWGNHAMEAGRPGEEPTFSTGTTSPSSCVISCCAACYPRPASSSEFKTLQSYWLVKSPKYPKENDLANGSHCVRVTVHHGL